MELTDPKIEGLLKSKRGLSGWEANKLLPEKRFENNPLLSGSLVGDVVFSTLMVFWSYFVSLDGWEISPYLSILLF